MPFDIALPEFSSVERAENAIRALGYNGPFLKSEVIDLAFKGADIPVRSPEYVVQWVRKGIKGDVTDCLKRERVVLVNGNRHVIRMFLCYLNPDGENEWIAACNATLKNVRDTIKLMTKKRDESSARIDAMEAIYTDFKAVAKSQQTTFGQVAEFINEEDLAA